VNEIGSVITYSVITAVGANKMFLFVIMAETSSEEVRARTSRRLKNAFVSGVFKAGSEDWETFCADGQYTLVVV